MTKFLFSEDSSSPSILYPLQFRYKINCWYIQKAVVQAYSGCIWGPLLTVDCCENEKVHTFVTYVGIDSLKSHQTQRFYCQRRAQVWCSSQQHEHWQVSNFPLLWCPNNEVLGLIVLQFRIIVQDPWMDVLYPVFDTFRRKKCVHIKWSQLSKRV